MLSLTKLLTICLTLGQGPVERASRSVDPSPCIVADSIRLSLRDPAFAAEWIKRCAPSELLEQALGKREPDLVGYGPSSTTTTATPAKSETVSSKVTSSSPPKSAMSSSLASVSDSSSKTSSSTSSPSTISYYRKLVDAQFKADYDLGQRDKLINKIASCFVAQHSLWHLYAHYIQLSIHYVVS
ncbi:hypothetical protein BAUCODRAFT_275454 [Baudoinia panamericana UAMH 10762]|uniref:Uncharacterized protein n=1 Tax=Baudoinia panamericana (strain UAMH 10762) TaxID=717646 RepID=M2M711_BAUPA|nr:uncharacterized protein BAUCODRAFT_275454 [Baudoinia panamericana UAMH 10762]EMC92071.1 hypothetical protein BAUCODRAFT_275454 [Baudoinia panamericana UAMH 10762]